MGIPNPRFAYVARMVGLAPPEVSRALAERVEALRARALGRSLDLETTPLVQAEGRYDTILCLVQISELTDRETFFASISDHLAEDGWLYVLEPVGDSADIPPAIRAGGLFVTDVHRFTLDHVDRPWRNFVEAWARYPTPAAAVS